jgi:UDP:flavonoid glycosyltransferase YjiC (YdhE family)
MTTENPPRILFFVEGISGAHVYRGLILAGWLKSLGCELIVAVPERFHALYRSYGFQVENLPIADPGETYRRLRSGGVLFLEETLGQYFACDEALIQKWRPALVVSEFRFTALQLAKNHSIPSVGITEAPCHPAFEISSSVPDALAQPSWMPLIFFTALASAPGLGAMLQNSFLRRAASPCQAASITAQLPALPTFFDYASQGDLCLIGDHPDFLTIPNLRPQDRYLGALIWARDEPLPEVLLRLPEGRKKIYISLGTQESLRASVIWEYVRAMLKHDVEIILSLGHREVAPPITDARLHVFDFLNDSELLPQIDLLVYPGGNMTTYQALWHGVPAIALPAHAHQHFYAEALAQNGCGAFFRPSRLDAQAMVRKSLALLDSSSREHVGAKAMQAKLRAFDVKRQVIEDIRRLLP